MEFEWFSPPPRKPELAITIPNDKCFNLNQNLFRQMPKQIAVGISADGKTICLKENPGTGLQIPKSGTINSYHLVAFIKKRGIKLPARYKVEQKEDHWLATLNSPVLPTPPKNTPKSPRKRGLRTMMNEDNNKAKAEKSL